jgi:signal transduction histidine kinase
MKPRGLALLRGLVIAGGAAVALGGVLAFRADHWPVYLAFFVLSGVLFLPSVEVLPRIMLAVPEMATTLGFLYIGGLPIVVLRFFSPLLARLVRRSLPAAWERALVRLRSGGSAPRRELFFEGWTASEPVNLAAIAEWSLFSIGLGARWWIAASLTIDAPPVVGAGVIALAEVAGYAAWWVLARLPVYPDHTLMPPPSDAELRSAFADMSLIIALALTPFVLLISYGYQIHGLGGAVGWSLSSLGLHFVLQRLHERRLRLEEQNRRLEALNRELEHRERLSAIGRMSSVVSHQILQQLGVIGIYADLIRKIDGAEDPAEQLAQARGNAAAIENALEDVNRVLRDLLVFSKDLRLNLYGHRLDRIVTECADECRAEAGERRVALAVAPLPAVELTADKLKLKQALLNVLRNAIEATPAGGSVSVDANLADGDVEIRVADQGPGVAESEREAIFAPFFTTKESGTGLGLAIARVFVEAHGGRIWVEAPRSGRGARFVMRLPEAPRAQYSSPEVRDHCTERHKPPSS